MKRRCVKCKALMRVVRVGIKQISTCPRCHHKEVKWITSKGG